jgi:hypothetical protein
MKYKANNYMHGIIIFEGEKRSKVALLTIQGGLI